MRAVVVCHDLSENAVGRAYVFWLLARELSWSLRVVGPAHGPKWKPINDSAFEEDTIVIPRGEPPRALFESADAIIALKARPGSFGTALRE